MLEQALELDRYLRCRIPITQAMGIRLGKYDQGGITLVAPLQPNLNDKATAFAGSMASITTLCGWAFTQITAGGAGHAVEVVVTHTEMRYLKPARHELSAHCDCPGAAAITDFLQRLAQRGRARWKLEVTLSSAGAEVLTCSAWYQATLVKSLDESGEPRRTASD